MEAGRGELRLAAGAGTCARNMASVIVVTEELVGRVFYYPFRAKEEVDPFFSTFPRRMWSRIVFSSRHGFLTGELHVSGAPRTLARIRREARVLSDTCLHGKVFVKEETIGLESLHFTSEVSGYVSFQDDTCAAWRLDDGSVVPPQKCFSETRYDAEARNFRGTINWSPSSFKGWRKYEYDLTFDESFMYVASGTVCTVEPASIDNKLSSIADGHRAPSFLEISEPSSGESIVGLSPPTSPQRGGRFAGGRYPTPVRMHSQSLLVFKRWHAPADAAMVLDQPRTPSSSSSSFSRRRTSSSFSSNLPTLSLGGSLDDSFGTCPLSIASAIIITSEGPGCSCYPYSSLEEAKDWFDRVSWLLCSRILYSSSEGFITEELCSAGPSLRYDTIRLAAGQLERGSLAGKVFVQDGQLGWRSIHFLNTCEAYMSFEHERCQTLKLDTGCALPARLYFQSTSHSAAARTFRGSLHWGLAKFNGAVRWECEMIFDEMFQEIAGGTVCYYGADGSNIGIDEFCSSEDAAGERTLDCTPEWRYRRWWQPALEVAFNFGRLGAEKAAF
mmetsp:Transcript_5235/g.12613  ORF Transcript_5235/g.12613 Transcript_5235/m.12613 type:complete len:557 (-) Transcript_5235:41-1711(-)